MRRATTLALMFAAAARASRRVPPRRAAPLTELSEEQDAEAIKEMRLRQEAANPECAATATELELARMEIAALEHDNELLSSENKILADENHLEDVVSDIREYLAHVMDGDDVVPP